MQEFEYASYFPQDLYDEIVTEIQQFKETIDTNNHTLTIDDKIYKFFLQLILYQEKTNELSKDNNYKILFGSNNANLDLLSPLRIAEVIFNKGMLPSVSHFLEQCDNTFFWKSLGISIEDGVYLKAKILESKVDAFAIINEVQNKMSKNDNVDKIKICKVILPWLQFDICKQELSNENLLFLHLLRHLSDKYYKIINRIVDTLNDIEITTPDISSFFCDMTSANLEESLQNKYNPKFLYDLFKMCIYTCTNVYLNFMYIFLNNSEMSIWASSINKVLAVSDDGYEIYNYYIEYCKDNNLVPGIIVDNPEVFFMNSYKAPQIKSLHQRYFPTYSDEKSKEQTIICFEKIYQGLKDNNYLDEDCWLDDFLWAFSLTEKYPFTFKKIKFYTISGRNKKDKGNGAFLCLLTILGYTSEEVKAMLHRNPEKSYINKTFDLSLKDNTKLSKDYNTLLEIVKSSGLPIQ